MADGILGIGVCTLDLITLVETLPAEEGVEMGVQSLVMGGGPVPTALCAAASLGSRCTMLDRFGDDLNSRHILAELECPPGQAMMVGDDFVNDVQSPREVGIPSVWLQRNQTS